MSAEQPGGPGATGAAQGTGPPPSEEELRTAYEAELARLSSTDVIAQAAVSLLNIAAFRLHGTGAAAGAGEQAAGAVDLEQARDAIDAARALLEILERRMPGEVRSLRDALSQLQLVYARAAQSAGAAPAAGAGPAQPRAADEGEAGGSKSGGGGGRGEGGRAEGAGEGAGEGGRGQAAQKPPPGQEGERRPGPAESSGRLWVPGS
jgi:hypothetical protein